MAAKKITVTISPDGKLHSDYDGFDGEACFQEAEKLAQSLAQQGLDMTVVKVDPKRREQELRKLETSQKVGV